MSFANPSFQSTVRNPTMLFHCNLRVHLLQRTNQTLRSAGQVQANMLQP